MKLGAFHWRPTEEEARAEARARLGPSADVSFNPLAWRAPYQITVARYESHGTRRVVVARGLTWERAFLSLEARQRREAQPSARRAPGRGAPAASPTLFG